jgi:hypothetical protein
MSYGRNLTGLDASSGKRVPSTTLRILTVIWRPTDSFGKLRILIPPVRRRVWWAHGPRPVALGGASAHLETVSGYDRQGRIVEESGASNLDRQSESANNATLIRRINDDAFP